MGFDIGQRVTVTTMKGLLIDRLHEEPPVKTGGFCLYKVHILKWLIDIFELWMMYYLIV
jgi:hypothetical protein